MSRPPSKGPLLYAPLCLSALLAALSFWLNPPPATPPLPNPTQPPTAPLAAPPSGATKAGTDTDQLPKLTSLLRDREPGDADTLLALETLAADPAAAVLLGRHLMQSVPARAPETGTILIGALLRNSNHSEAIKLAQAGPDAERAAWIALILSHWAATEPDAGAIIVDQLRLNEVNTATFALVAKNWATAAPGELARYALSLPSGDYRALALDAALVPWLQQDSAAVADTLPHLADPSERNLFLAALAEKSDPALQPAGQGLRWAESITDPALRRETLRHVVREWSASDPAAALAYLTSAPDFTLDQRHTMLAELTPPIEPL